MKKKFIAGLATGVLLLGGVALAQASSLDQYASSVIGYSSQWSGDSWSAAQALGQPNTDGYGDFSNSWAPGPKNGTQEYLTLGFTTPVYSNGAVIRETYGNGFVYQVDVIGTNNVSHTVWTGTDPSLPGTPVDFNPTWAMTNYQVNQIKIYVDTNHNLNAWEEIDAVKLQGSTTPTPEPATMLLLGSGLAGLLGARRQKKG